MVPHVAGLQLADRTRQQKQRERIMEIKLSSYLESCTSLTLERDKRYIKRKTVLRLEEVEGQLMIE